MRQKSVCKECKGGGFCDHSRQRSRLRLDVDVRNVKEEVFVNMIEEDLHVRNVKEEVFVNTIE
jgi:hypothetical protein